jgi:hypothetical protein
MDELRLQNPDAYVTLARAFGPRVTGYGRHGKNALGQAPHVQAQTPHGLWRAHGGHRLWVAPESMPLSYEPDDSPVTITEHGPRDVTLTQKNGPAGIEKRMRVTLAETGSETRITHTLIQDTAQKIAAWALTIMADGATAIVPQEPVKPHSECFDPARPMVLWHFSDLRDPRYTFGPESIRIHADAARGTPQKLGFGNHQGWLAAETSAGLFTKRFAYDAAASYPDFGSNCEVFTQGAFLELESLSPLSDAREITHVETWTLT